MELDFLKAFGSAYIQQNDGGRKVDHHTYRACVEILEGCESGHPVDSRARVDLYESILNLQKKDKRLYLLQRYEQVFAAKSQKSSLVTL